MRAVFAGRMTTWCGAAALVLAACADAGSNGAWEREQTALTSAEETESSVYVLDSGSWGTYVYRGFTSQSFWVDLAVRADGGSKDVGIVWTQDGWQTSQWTRATYEGPLPDGRERWGVDVPNFGTFMAGSIPEVEYAAFATLGGTTRWSPFRNHFIYRPVSLARPVRLLSARIGWDGATVRLEGETRSLRTATARRVFVRYTLDRWATWQEAEATESGAEHRFSIPLAVDPEATEEVRFAIRVETDGQSAWDNNGGSDHRFFLAPQVTASLINAPDYAVDGIVVLSATAQTALSIERARYRIDGGSWSELPLRTTPSGTDGFEPAGAIRALLATGSLGAGEHRVELQVQAGPFWRAAPSLDLDVADLVRSSGTTALPASDLGTAWDVDRDPSGRLVVAHDRGLVRLDASGAVERNFEVPEDSRGYFGSVEANTRYVFALASTLLTRWDAETGSIDRSFGASGSIELADRTFGGKPLCYASHLAVSDDALFVTDSCNARLLRLTLDGEFVDAIELLGDASFATVLTPVIDGPRVWVVRSTYDEGLVSALISVAATPGAPLARLETVPLDRRLGATPEAFAVAVDGFWITSGDDLRHFDRTGVLTATWLGSSVYESNLPGVLSIARDVELRSDGVVDVLSVQTGRIESFTRAR